MRRLALALLTLALAAPALAADPPPLRFVGAVEKVTLSPPGAPPQTLYRVAPGKTMRLATHGPMTLVIVGRALLSADASATPVLTIAVSGSAGGAALTSRKEILAPDATTRIPAGAGVTASAVRTIRVPLPSSSQIELTVDRAPGVAVGFSRAAYEAPAVAVATPTPTPAEPRLDDSVLAAIPMIRKSVEKFSIGAKGGVLVPGSGSFQYGGLANLYAGAELRFSPPQFERRLSVGVEALVYELRRRDPIVSADPFGSSDAGDVVLTTRVVPVLAGLTWRQPLGESFGLFAGAGGGAAFTQRTESVRFRNERSRTDTIGAGYVRLGVDWRMARGRAVSFGTSWMHVADDEDTGYLGGLMTGLQWRMLY